MATVAEWFEDFCRALVVRSARTDWPESGSGYWDDFQRELVRNGVRWDEADSAISRVCNTPNLFLSDVRPLLIAEVAKIRREPIVPEAGIVSDPKEAERLSRDCPECEGTGVAIRYVHDVILGKLRTSNGSNVPVGYSASFPCSCPLGLLSARSRAGDGKPPVPTIDGYPTLRRVPVPWASTRDGLDNRFRYRPADWDEANGRPFAFESDAIKDVGDLKALVRTIASKPPRGSLQASASMAWANGASAAQGHHHEPASGLPEHATPRPDLLPAREDPVVARELATTQAARPIQPVPPARREPVADEADDDDPDGWF